MTLEISICLPIFFFVGVLCLETFSALQTFWGKFRVKQFLWKRPRAFFFRFFLQRFFSKEPLEGLFTSTHFAKHLLLLFYGGFAFSSLGVFLQREPIWFHLVGFLLLAVISFSFCFLFRLLTFYQPSFLLTFFSFLISCYLVLLFPFLGFFFQIHHRVFNKKKANSLPYLKGQLQEMLKESDLPLKIDSNDAKLLSSFILFKDRVAKEIMVPRIHIAALCSKTKLKDSMKLFETENYSRVPVYQENLDHIIGVLLFKDVLKVFAETLEQEKSSLQTPVENFIKPVIYIPGNKKISHLLQEFRMKQRHFAIVVDEYGGTEGVVTIEDVLEELVGEIEDEYDLEPEKPYWKLPNGDWIVDAKMSILDLENKLNIHIPSHSDYETIGGYMFHRAGSIPPQGWIIYHDQFILEVLNTTERSIEKIRITPRKQEEEGL